MRNSLHIDEAKADELMARYGIRCIPINQYHYRKYRYSQLADAIEQARRDDSPESI